MCLSRTYGAQLARADLQRHMPEHERNEVRTLQELLQMNFDIFDVPDRWIRYLQ